MDAKIVVDSSVLIQWFKARDEELLDEARHHSTFRVRKFSFGHGAWGTPRSGET
jgi:hypothetical protein